MENKTEAPIINMGTEKSEVRPTAEKPSYEQLEKQVYNLAEQCQAFYEKLQQANMFNTFKRLDYCFKVVENVTQFPAEFVEYCKKDIMNIMTLDTEEPANTEA